MMDQSELKPENFINEVATSLKSKDFASALSLFNNKQHQQFLKNNSWDLIPILCKHITKEERRKDNELASCCQELLEKLSAEANPEEAVLEFLDQMDEADNEKFNVILNLLKIIFSRKIQNRTKSLEWTLNSIRSYMEQYTYDENSDEFAALEEDEDYYTSEKITEIEDVTSSVIIFFEHFIREANEGPDAEVLQSLLSSRLLQMYDIFFPFIKLESYPQLKLLQNQISRLLLQVVSNPMTLLEYVFYRSLNVIKPKPDVSSKATAKDIDHDLRDESHYENLDLGGSLNPLEDETIVSDLAYGMFFYSLLTETENEQTRLPLVYNPKYIMLALIHVTVPFFEKKTDIVISNGLNFLTVLLNQLSDSLTKSDLYFSSHKAILISLNSVMVFSQVEENRKLALACFKKYIESFNWEGRYLLLLNFRCHVHHSGTLGFLISLLKDFVSAFLDLPISDQTNRKFSKYYKGKLLFDIIKKYCYLPHGAGTDLVENADHIISSLNALRYLVLKDKRNVTDIRNFIRKIDKDFLKPLKEKIISSKGFYDLKLKDLESSPSKSGVDNTESEVELEVAMKGQTLPKLTREQQKAAYHSCLNAVDLMDSLLIRLTECTRGSYSVRHCSSKNTNDAQKDSDDQQYENTIREKILNASLQFVPKYGWSKEAISNGAESIGYSGVASGIFPKGGVDLINHFYIQCNQKLKEHMIEVSNKSEKPIKPKDFIQNSVEIRLRMLIPYIDNWAQAIGIMSLPPNVPVALANLLTLVDDICYYAGDKSVDFNWYTRRIGVGGIYKMSELYMLQDKSVDYKETWNFLDRRLTEAFQLQQVLSSSSGATSVAKDVVTSAFITARNILRLNIPR